MSAPQILRSAHGSPSRVRGPENQVKPAAFVALLEVRLAAIRAEAAK